MDKYILTVRPLRPHHDSHDVHISGPEHTGMGYKELMSPGEFGLIRCPSCGRENYVMAVSSGVCSHCGWDINDHTKGL
jgi:ribosomal protein S27E